MGQDGDPHGHAVIQDGDEAGVQVFNAHLHGRVVAGDLQQSRQGDPFPVPPRRKGQLQPGVDCQQDGRADSEAVAGKEDRREKERRLLHGDPVKSPNGVYEQQRFDHDIFSL